MKLAPFSLESGAFNETNRACEDKDCMLSLMWKQEGGQGLEV